MRYTPASRTGLSAFPSCMQEQWENLLEENLAFTQPLIWVIDLSNFLFVVVLVIALERCPMGIAQYRELLTEPNEGPSSAGLILDLYPSLGRILLTIRENSQHTNQEELELNLGRMFFQRDELSV